MSPFLFSESGPTHPLVKRYPLLPEQVCFLAKVTCHLRLCAGMGQQTVIIGCQYPHSFRNEEKDTGRDEIWVARLPSGDVGLRDSVEIRARRQFGDSQTTRN